jgi:hypothetical protein
MPSPTMVILESESRWPDWLDEPSQALVAQRPGESPSAFESRAARFIMMGPAPLTATVVTSPADGPEHRSLRRTLVQALLDVMRPAGRGHVVLVADGDHAACRGLARLAETLHREVGSESNLSLRLRILPRTAVPDVGAARRVA